MSDENAAGTSKENAEPTGGPQSSAQRSGPDQTAQQAGGATPARAGETEQAPDPLGSETSPEGGTRQAPARARKGMFGIQGSGDTSGFGGLALPGYVPAPAERPYGGWFDAFVDEMGAALAERGVDGAVEQITIDRGEITFYVDPERLLELCRTLRDDQALRFEMCASVSGVDYGADVVKVEGPGGDDTRTWQPPVRGDVSTYYLGVNRNKRSVTLDLKDPDDLALARELARRADVVVENFKPGGLARFGLDYDAVAAANPGVVYASITGFGSQPGGAELPGYDLIVQAISGLMSLTGAPDGEPYRAGVAVFDVMAGLHATIGVLSALNLRHETGRGQRIEVNLLASAMSGLVNQTSAFVAGGVVPFRMGNSHPSLFPYEPLPCSDGDLIITAGNDGQFRKLVTVLGVPGLADDPRFADNGGRVANRAELRTLLVERLRTRTKMEWFRDIIAAGVPCGPINTVDQGVAFAEEVGLEPVVVVGEGDAAVPSVRNPIRFSETPPDYRLPPPSVDEHGAEIRKWLSSDG